MKLSEAIRKAKEKFHYNYAPLTPETKAKISASVKATCAKRHPTV